MGGEEARLRMETITKAKVFSLSWLSLIRMELIVGVEHNCVQQGPARFLTTGKGEAVSWVPTLSSRK